ncbi:MAG: transglycosylase domain-containing protein [Myxococcales bacterium]|nr:transglycosylase domain-containing protein [Myxococcales bacterium]
MRLRLSRRQLIGAAVGLVLLLAASVAFGPIVRARVASEAQRRHLAVRVGAVRPGWFSVRLRDVSVQPDGVTTMRAHLDDVRVGLSAGLRVRRVDVSGAEIILTGPAEVIRDDYVRWRGDRAEAAKEGAGHTVDVDVGGMRVRWAEPDAPGHAAELRGVAMVRDERGFRLSMTEGHAAFGAGELSWSEASAQADDKGMLLQARASALTVGWKVTPPEGQRSTAGAGAPVPPPLPPPVIARATRPGRRPARPAPPPPPADAGAPLLPLPDLHAVRGRVSALASVLAERVKDGAQIRVDSLTWKISQDAERVALTIGPGPLSVARDASGLEVDYSTETRAAGTPFALRAVLPMGRNDVVLTTQGGPVSLSLLGVQEQAAGLVDVDKATLTGRARVVLSGDGSALTFDAEGGARNLSVNHPKLALDTVRGLDVGLRARGVANDQSELRLDEFAATLGALRVAGSGTLEQKADHVSGGARFEVPTASCQSLLDSIPTALLPTLQGTRFAGTFGARGHFAFDTRSLDDLELKYDIQDKCRLVQVPATLSRERFEKPFTHRIYHPDGTTAEEITGPGTDDWTSLVDISPYMVTAVLTTEDGAFPKHHGYNHAAIRASIIANLKARRFVRGASTISMQLAKNLFLSRDKTLSRKLEEVVLTDYLEQTFSKDEILELYLNVIEFGPSIYGITPAAEYYFGRSPAELSLGESLFLSSILPAPLRYASMRDGEQPPEGWSRLLRSLMEIANKRGLVSDAELAQAESEPILFWHGGPRPTPRPPVAGRAAHGLTPGKGADIPDPFESLPEGQ